MTFVLDGCIFCGGADMSEEHLVADWVTRAFMRSRKPRSDFSGAFVAPNQMRLSREEPISAAKVVCTECNNTWMSRIDDDAAQVLKPLVRGKSEVRLTPPAQQAVAAWLFKSALVFDASDRGRDGRLAPLRADFARTCVAPPGMVIYLGPAPHTPFRVDEIPEIAGLALFGIRPISGRLNLTLNVKNPDGSITPGTPRAIPTPGYLVMLGRLNAMMSGVRAPIIPTPGQGFERVWPVSRSAVTISSAQPHSDLSSGSPA